MCVCFFHRNIHIVFKHAVSIGITVNNTKHRAQPDLHHVKDEGLVCIQIFTTVSKKLGHSGHNQSRLPGGQVNIDHFDLIPLYKYASRYLPLNSLESAINMYFSISSSVESLLL